MKYTEIDRATDNLVKSGKWMAGSAPPYNNRRESMPPMMMGRNFGGNSEFGEYFLNRFPVMFNSF